MPIDHSDDVCLSCRLSPPAFESGLSAFLFASPVTELIYQLKFRHSMVVGRALGEGLADRVTQCVASIPNIVIPDVVIPVPLHASRVRERGFNQSVEIARPVAERLRIPLVCRAVSRTVATPAQSLLMTRRARVRNLRGAFTVNTSAMRGVSVGIIDDVLTSGATVSELTRTLLASGAREVHVWTVARAT